MKNHAPLEKNRKTKVKNREYWSRLIITDLDVLDSGYYQCVVSNSVASVNTTAVLRVSLKYFPLNFYYVNTFVEEFLREIISGIETIGRTLRGDCCQKSKQCSFEGWNISTISTKISSNFFFFLFNALLSSLQRGNNKCLNNLSLPFLHHFLLDFPFQNQKRRIFMYVK